MPLHFIKMLLGDPMEICDLVFPNINELGTTRTILYRIYEILPEIPMQKLF